MDDPTIRDFIASVSEQVLILDRNLANLRAAVIVLQAIAHSRCRRMIQQKQQSSFGI